MHTELYFGFFLGLLIREYEFISLHQKQLTRTLGISYFVLKFVGVQLYQYQPLNSILQLKKKLAPECTVLMPLPKQNNQSNSHNFFQHRKLQCPYQS